MARRARPAPPSGRGGHRRDDRTRIQEPRAAGLQPHPADRRGVRRPLTPLSLYLKLGARTARRGPQQLPARIGGRRRALRPLFVHRPAGAYPAARDRASTARSSPTGASSRPTMATQSTSSPTTRRLPRSGSRPAGLPRFCGGAGYFGYDAIRYIGAAPRGVGTCEAARRPCSATPDVLLVQCEEVAVHRQPVGAGQPDRLRLPRRSRTFASVRRRAVPRHPPLLCERHGAGRRARRGEPAARLREGGLPRRGREGEGLHRRRRPDAGGGRQPMTKPAKYGIAAQPLPRLRSLSPSPDMYFYDLFISSRSSRSLPEHPGAARIPRRRR